MCLRCWLTRDYKDSHNPEWAGWLRTLTVTALVLSINNAIALVLAANSVLEYIICPKYDAVRLALVIIMPNT